MERRRCLVCLVVGWTLVWSLAQPNGALAQPTEVDDAAWDQAVGKAVEFLRTQQNPDGSWGAAPRNRGISGVVVTGLLRTGKVGASDAPAAKGLAFIESLVNAKEGHIAGQEAIRGLQNYCTSVNVMALVAAKRRDKYTPVVGDAVSFLKKLQWDDGEGKSPQSDYYGGAGYDSKSRPDLSNTQFFLDALHDAGLAKTDPAFQKALVFVSRCQNFKSEFNDQPWSGAINDGSFIYSAAGGGSTKVPGEGLKGYGSMTYAGIKSMIYCGVDKNDPRYQKALEWIRANYTLDGNPGMPAQLDQQGLYYYYHTMAKTLATMGVDTLTDADGVKHDWRAELSAALIKRQRPDGSWVNENDRWMEGDPSLVTGFALMALSYCKK